MVKLANCIAVILYIICISIWYVELYHTHTSKESKWRCQIHQVRLTVYWSHGKGTDALSQAKISSTGAPLIQGHSIAVNPKSIPYGSVAIIPGYGMAKAIDTGSAVKSCQATHHTTEVIDLYFEDRETALAWANNHPKEIKIKVYTPTNLG